ncbi:MAG TPA: DUF445 family protein [Capillibacterium sp.]
MFLTTEKMFFRKWLQKLKNDLRHRLDQGAAMAKPAMEEGEKRPLSLKVAKVLNFLNYPLFWGGILFLGWLLLEFVLETFFAPAFLSSLQRYSAPVVAVLGPAVVGYWTNWLAIKMLFHPQRKNAVWWGLIHARREGLITSLAAGIRSSLISPEIIRDYLADEGVLSKLTAGVARALDDVLKDPAFREELEAVLTGLLRRMLADPRTREEVDRYLASILAEWEGASLRGKMLAWTKQLWEGAFRKRIWTFLDELPEGVAVLMPRLMAALETIPAKLEGEARTVESLVAELVAEGLNRIDFESVIRGQLAKMDPTALERLLTANICEELVFIQTSGGIFGFLVGLAILFPFLRPVFLLGGLVLWVVYRLTVDKK